MKRFAVLALISLLLLSSAFAVLGSANSEGEDIKLGAWSTSNIQVEYRFMDGSSSWGTTIPDNSGNGYNAQLNGTYEWGDGYLHTQQCGINTTTSVPAPVNGTWILYAKFNSLTTSGGGLTLIFRDNSGVNDNDHQFAISTTPAYKLAVQYGGSTTTVFDTGTPDTTGYHYIVLTKSGNSYTLYVDNNTVATGSATADYLGNPAAPIWIAYNGRDSYSYLDANLKYFAQLDVALGSISEVQDYFNQRIQGTSYTFTVYAQNGTVTINGVTYTNGQQVSLDEGSYTIVANPADGYTFDHWVTVGIYVDDVHSSSTTLHVISDGSIEAIFVQSNDDNENDNDTNTGDDTEDTGGAGDTDTDTDFWDKDIEFTLGDTTYSIKVWILLVAAVLILLIFVAGRRR